MEVSNFELYSFDLKTIDKRKLRKIKEKDIKFNIKNNSEIINKQENKNDRINKEKTKIEERKMKDRIHTLNNLLNYFLRGKQIQMKMNDARGRANNINMLIPKNYEEL